MKALLIEHYSAFHNPFGCSRANLHSLWRRIVWQVFINNAKTAKLVLCIVLSVVALILLAPIFLVIGLLIKLEDAGPIFFCQRRVGKDGREFKMYKFRSMRQNAESQLATLMLQNQHKEGVT